MSGKQPIYHRHLDTPPGEYDEEAIVAVAVDSRTCAWTPEGGLLIHECPAIRLEAAAEDIAPWVSRQALSDRDARIKHLEALAREVDRAWVVPENGPFRKHLKALLAALQPESSEPANEH